MGYVPFPKFVPTHVTNFGGTTSRLVARREIAGVGLMFPRADRPIAVEWAGHAVSTLHPIAGLEFVFEAVTALGSSTELAGNLFRAGGDLEQQSNYR